MIVGDESRADKNAENDGWSVLSFSEATSQADVVCLLVADPAQPAIYKDSVRANFDRRQDARLCARIQCRLRAH